MTKEHVRSKVKEAYTVVLPPAVREALGVREGEEVVFHVEGGAVTLTAERSKARAIQEKYAGKFPGLLEEFLKERREDAERE